MPKLDNLRLLIESAKNNGELKAIDYLHKSIFVDIDEDSVCDIDDALVEGFNDLLEKTFNSQEYQLLQNAVDRDPNIALLLLYDDLYFCQETITRGDINVLEIFCDALDKVDKRCVDDNVNVFIYLAVIHNRMEFITFLSKRYTSADFKQLEKTTIFDGADGGVLKEQVKHSWYTQSEQGAQIERKMVLAAPPEEYLNATSAPFEDTQKQTAVDVTNIQISEPRSKEEILQGIKDSYNNAMHRFKANNFVEDQAKYWQKFADALTNVTGGGQKPYDIIMASNAISCSFAEEEMNANTADEKGAIANTLLYYLGATVPKWSLTWNGTFNTDLFTLYTAWINAIHPQGLDPSSNEAKECSKELSKIKKKISNYNDGIDDIMLSQYKEWNKIPEPLQTIEGPTFMDYWTKYQRKPAYKYQIDDLNAEAGADLDGLQYEYSTIADTLYGPGYQQIAEAVKSAAKADPESTESLSLDLGERLQYQMPVNVAGYTSFSAKNDVDKSKTPDSPADNKAEVFNFKPRFIPEENYNDFQKWLNDAKAGQGPSLAFEVDKNTQINDSSSYHFGGGGGFPIEDIFVIGGNVSGGHSSVDISKYDFKISVSYDSITHVPITPDDSWYNSGLLKLYSGYDNWEDGSPFKGKTLWGPDGILNIRVSGVYVGYHPTIKVTSPYWDDFTKDINWSEKTDVSLFGLISLGSESSGGSSRYNKKIQIDSGFQIEDTSDVPKIIGLTTELLNYDG